MKITIKLLGILVLIALASCNSPGDSELTSQEKQTISSTLIELSQNWVSAIQNDDYEQLDQILSEDLAFYGNGEVLDKPKVLKHYIEDVPDFDSIDLFDMTVHVYSSSLAMIMGKAKYVFEDEMGQVIEYSTTWSNLYRKEKEQWKCIFGQGCRIIKN